MNYLDHLNDAQREAVVASSKYVRVIAGAGSGKTRVLIARIAHLMDHLGVYGGSIVAITFTNKAANEMKERLQLYAGDKAAGVHVSTIHSLCVRILREDGPSMKLPRNFTVLDQDDQKVILKEALTELKIDKQKHTINSLLDYIGGNKGAEITPQRALELAGFHPGEREKAQIYGYYVDRQNALYALDFDDLLLVTVKLFDLYSDVLHKWQRRFNFIHVDEFQDIDGVQYKLIKQLAGPDNSLYVVGDPDQTIYTWRGADVNLILNMTSDFKGTQTVVLNQNYRSTSHILGSANSLIKFNQYREPKDLFTTRDSDVKVTHCTFASEEHEAKWIAEKIKAIHKTGTAYKDIAVLYRASYLSRSIEKGMMEAQIPYVIWGGTRFYDRQEVKNMLAYLRMIVHGDDLAFKRIINVPKRGIGEKSIDAIFELAKSSNRSLYDTVKASNPLKGKLGAVLDDFVAMIEGWREKAQTLPLMALFELVENESGLKFMYEANNETDRLENVKELINDITLFNQQYPDAGLDEYLQMVALYGDRNEVSQGDFIILMTVHAAKGLEFGTVFVIGMSEGVFPNERAMSEGKRGLEEERRLAYVAYTRAKNKLYLSESKGYSFVLGGARRMSRFIEEIDEKHIDHIGVNYDYATPKEIHLNAQPKTIGFADKMANGKPLGFKADDWVSHPQFGEGKVLSIFGGLAEILFGYQWGIRKILASHPSLTKIEVHDE